MRKPVVNLREFRLSKINDPHFKHFQFLLGWVGYFILYFLTENLIPAEKCTPVWCPLDDIIPFCEYFIIPYAGWYLLIVISLVYFGLYNPDNFKSLMKFIITTQVVAMIIYIIWPTRQDLRPTEFVNNNIFTNILGLIYTFDTNTGVCPSLHVAYSIGIASTWLKEKSASIGVKTIVTVFCFFVCISVAFVKQHSVLDIFAAIPVCILAELIAFGWIQKWWKKLRKSDT